MPILDRHDRRRFLQQGISLLGLTAAIVPAVPYAAAFTDTGKAQAHPRADLVVLDVSLAPAPHFALQAARQGHQVVTWSGDMTRLWNNDLHPLWSHGPATVAGLTSANALFCIEQLAWGHFMRAWTWQIHKNLGGEEFVSWIIGPRTRSALA